MKVIEHLANATRPLVSVEIIPPRRGGDVQRIYEAVASVMPFDPPFIDITSHSAEAVWEELPDGTYRRRVTRKAPGTFGLCAAIKHRFGVDPVPHVLCNGFTREETEDSLIELNYLGIENVLAIRGDGQPREPVGGRSVNETGLDLVGQIADMNRGRYLEDLLEATPTDFCIGVAAYPEKHVEAPNLDWDIDVLLQKQRAGADYAVTQIFYDNEPYLRFVKACRDHGVTIPIIPGLKILTRKEQLGVIPKIFGVDVPPALAEAVREAEPDRVVEVGTRWALEQAIHLLEAGVPSLHFYVMQNTRPFVSLMERLAPSI
ncbi:MAG TPA: methylenetetrahydrofolate reductase [Actinomycetota bacterium]|nr:methylenetetrahydrofolate reductase [Actinomycetota bacterium]